MVGPAHARRLEAASLTHGQPGALLTEVRTRAQYLARGRSFQSFGLGVLGWEAWRGPPDSSSTFQQSAERVKCPRGTSWARCSDTPVRGGQWGDPESLAGVGSGLPPSSVSQVAFLEQGVFKALSRGRGQAGEPRAESLVFETSRTSKSTEKVGNGEGR